ncbi:hypothetical protein D9757_007855 [Collybiopsis confluens]|uniref:Uncharacterized protein n=1 Tax=Collybiopsis confluens TaxID=2823264 RepID=A0A8H5HDA3_9AGAR|nr:hypothetical protein D9757_007855 [Collybiopsis confluens]
MVSFLAVYFFLGSFLLPQIFPFPTAFRENSTQLVYRDSSGIDVPIKLWINLNLEDDASDWEQHWALVFMVPTDKVFHGVHAITKETFPDKHNKRPTKPLVPEIFDFDKAKEYKLLNLDLKAHFRTEKEMRDYFTNLKTKIKITHLPYEESGDCLEYLQSVLHYTVQQKLLMMKDQNEAWVEARDVPSTFTGLYNRSHAGIKQTVWPKPS